MRKIVLLFVVAALALTLVSCVGELSSYSDNRSSYSENRSSYSETRSSDVNEVTDNTRGESQNSYVAPTESGKMSARVRSDRYRRTP